MPRLERFWPAVEAQANPRHLLAFVLEMLVKDLKKVAGPQEVKCTE